MLKKSLLVLMAMVMVVSFFSVDVMADEELTSREKLEILRLENENLKLRNEMAEKELELEEKRIRNDGRRINNDLKKARVEGAYDKNYHKAIRERTKYQKDQQRMAERKARDDRKGLKTLMSSVDKGVKTVGRIIKLFD